ncbi:glycosyltransferase family 2 protein [Butyrivibrio sp. NC3005]|uniref:glycosyltransferase family 2 protein n=1 Tax=Butyrivibrio sp. NC3005 TaxID=1280685 RepID=UPI00041FC8D7|nr:glycosyltransferase family 2 protein [Butyrivibrio sp. NC3005]
MKAEKEPAKISIIVPVYRAENVIASCVNSILKQTFGEFELILVDDGSPDESGIICDKLAAKDKRIKVIHKVNGGPSSAVVCGLKHAKGKYIFFVDGDDYIEPNTLEKLCSKLSCTKKEVICSNYVEDRVRGKKIFMTMPASPGVYEDDDLNKLKQNLIGNEHRPIFLSRCFKLYSAELVFDNLHYLDTTIRMGDDVNMITPVLMDAERIVVMEKSYFYHYVFYKDSLVHSFDEGLYDNCVRLREKLKVILKEKGIEDYEKKATNEFLFLLFLCVKSQMRSSAKTLTVTSKIKEYCQNENAEKMIEEYPYKINSLADKLLAFVCKKPAIWRVAVIRCLFKYLHR